MSVVLSQRREIKSPSANCTDLFQMIPERSCGFSCAPSGAARAYWRDDDLRNMIALVAMYGLILFADKSSGTRSNFVVTDRVATASH